MDNLASPKGDYWRPSKEIEVLQHRRVLTAWEVRNMRFKPLEEESFEDFVFFFAQTIEKYEDFAEYH